MKIKDFLIFITTFLLRFTIFYILWWNKEEDYNLYSKEMQNFSDINYVHNNIKEVSLKNDVNKNIEIISVDKDYEKKDFLNKNELKEDIIKNKYIEIIFESEKLAYNIWNTNKINHIYNILDSKKFENLDINTSLTLKDEKTNIRWNFYKNKINIFKSFIKEKEFLRVFIHELWHYVDIEFLNKNLLWIDKSNLFYNISWDDTKILKKDNTNKSFISWYAMTNKYEDFAESFTYYILHNKDFLIKAQKDKKLKEKYLFFNKYIFNKNEFVNTDFSWKIKKYHYDTTKIDYNLEKFISYINKNKTKFGLIFCYNY